MDLGEDEESLDPREAQDPTKFCQRSWPIVSVHVRGGDVKFVDCAQALGDR